MKIGFDISQTGRLKAGCGYFAEGLIRHLAAIDSENEYILYPTFGDVYWDPDWRAATVQINRPNFRRGLGHRSFEDMRSFWTNPPADLELQLGQADIVHSNNFFCPTVLKKARLVYTLYDLGFMEYPESTTEANRLACFNGVFYASLHADLVVAISEYSRHHFLEMFPHYPSEGVVVAFPASRFARNDGLARPVNLAFLQPGQFWLNVGTLEPRKNQRRLLQTYARLKAHLGKTFPLLFAGGKGWLVDDLEKNIDVLGLRQDVILLGYVDDTALQWLYQNCFAFIYPSLFEGFGMPVLEAMSLGAPVITSNITAIPEIVGSAALLVDPVNEAELFQSMLRLAESTQMRAILRNQAMRRVAAFSWEATAERVLRCYQDLMGSRGE